MHFISNVKVLVTNNDKVVTLTFGIWETPRTFTYTKALTLANLMGS